MFPPCQKDRENGWKEGGEKERKKRKKVDRLSTPGFSVPSCPYLCLRRGSFRSPAPSISHSPEDRPTGVYVSKAPARLPELGMLKRPGLAFFGFQLWQLSHPHPEGAGPHTSQGVSKREEIITRPRRKRGRGDRRSARGSGSAPHRRARGWPVFGGCAAPGSAAARARALGVVAGWREGRAGAGPRRRADAELRRAS